MVSRPLGVGYRSKWVVILLGLCLPLHWAAANGFRNPPEGGRALALPNGRTALIDDATAVTHNPANLLDMAGPGYVEGLTVVHSERDYKGVSGSGTTDEPWGFIPWFFIATPVDLELGGEKKEAAVGIGISSPFGQATEWSETGPFAFTAPFLGEILTVAISPTVAMRVHPKVQVGVGVNAMYSRLKIKQRFPWSVATGDPTDIPGTARFEGDGTSAGVFGGISFDVAPNHRISAVAKSEIKVDYEGDFDINNIPGDLGFPLNLAIKPRTDFASEITFPASYIIAYGWQASEKLHLGADLEWVQFSSYDVLPLDIQSNNVLLPVRDVPQDWDDTITVGLGAEYDLNRNVVLRGGYGWLESPIPEETLAPTLPDPSRHILTVGIGYEKGRHGFDLAYLFSIYDDLDVTSNVNPAYLGEYDSETHVVSVSHRFVF